MVENKYQRHCKECKFPLVFDPFTSCMRTSVKCFEALFYCDKCKTAHTVEFMLPYDKEGFYWSEVKDHFLDHLHVLDWSDPSERTRIEETYNARRANYTLVEFDPTSDFKIIKAVLTAYKQTSQEDFTHVFKTVEIQIPNDGLDWHVVGEEQE